MNIQETAREEICLRCPRGCELKAVLNDDGRILSIEGNNCKLGTDYIKQEIADPRRVLPTTVRVKNGRAPLAPVWTPEPIPKKLLLELAEESRKIEIEAPVHIGDVVLKNWRGTGIDLVASGEVPAAY